MGNCCIPYKKVDNIDGSSQVTFNDKTSFDGADVIDCNELICDELIANVIESDAIEAGTVRVVELFSDYIENANNISTDTLEANSANINEATIETLNSVHINNHEEINTDTLTTTTSITVGTDVPVGNITDSNIKIINNSIIVTNNQINPNTQIQGCSIYLNGQIDNAGSQSEKGVAIDSTADYIDIAKPLRLHNILGDGNNKGWVSHVPAYYSFSSMNVTYTWPYPPGARQIGSFIFLTSDPSGSLSWDSQTINYLPFTHPVPTSITFLTSDSSGKLSWENVTIPASQLYPAEEPPPAPKTVVVGPYLTSDTSGNLSWDTTTVIVDPTPIPIPAIDTNTCNIMVDDVVNISGKEYKIPRAK